MYKIVLLFHVSFFRYDGKKFIESVSKSAAERKKNADFLMTGLNLLNSHIYQRN